MHVVYQPLWRIVLHSLFIDKELVLFYSFKIILNQLDISYQEEEVCVCYLKHECSN